MLDMWNARYADPDYAYGTEPNSFFKHAVNDQQLTGKILLPAEGEGRNAVFAAGQGLEVTAFDISEEGKKKALKLAKEKGVSITYEVGNLPQLALFNETFDAAALIYAHFPPPILHDYHRKVAERVKPGGIIVLEGFSKNHLPLREKNPAVGGPNNIDMLFSIESIQRDFVEFDPILLEESTVELNEGRFHNGMSKVIRFIGRKNE